MVTNDMGVASTLDNNCALHWLQFSIPCDKFTADDFLKSVCDDIFYTNFSDFEISRNTLKGFKGYKTKYDHDGITILAEHYANVGIMVLLTGKACDTAAPDIQWIDMYLQAHGGKTSRIDIAIDDHAGLLDIATIDQARRDNTCITRFEKARSIDESNLKAGTTSRPTVIFGSEKSDFQIRFYDRAAKEGIEGHWVRCEIQCRDAYATAVMKKIACGIPLVKIAAGILQNKLSFRIAKGYDRKRWPVCDWWKEFLQDTERLPLGIFKDRQASTSETQLLWLERTVAPALATVRRKYGIGRIEALCDLGDRRHGARRQRNVTIKLKEAA